MVRAIRPRALQRKHHAAFGAVPLRGNRGHNSVAARGSPSTRRRTPDAGRACRETGALTPLDTYTVWKRPAAVLAVRSASDVPHIAV
jgi:hypothetical protein